MKQIGKKMLSVFTVIFAGGILLLPYVSADNSSVHANTNISGVRTVEDDTDLNSSSEHPEQDLKKTEESSQVIELKVVPELQVNRKTSDSELSDHEEMELDQIEHQKETGKITETEAELEKSTLVSTEAMVKF